ncbi:hypothetical protein CEXT_78231 [Caerostris extrusa]|uniref:Uncharacterized protein n=1 Tax=Caerostris extrusa TaxID=172846 RepID=A0AAV4XNT3_CAEEX|nr:hypothetical protein CEXT_78231 [Caerostris extrusa]
MTRDFIFFIIKGFFLSRIDRYCAVFDNVSEYFPPLFSAAVSTPRCHRAKKKNKKRDQDRNKRKTSTLATAVWLYFLNNKNKKAKKKKGNKNIKRKYRVFIQSAFSVSISVCRARPKRTSSLEASIQARRRI